MKTDITIENLIARKYEQEYFDECKYIWQHYVPKRGQSKTLQGELLREIEKIRCEAQDNGNVNWNDDFSRYCDFITDALLSQSVFAEDDKAIIRVIMDYLKSCGQYAERYNNGHIKDKDVIPSKLAYINDNLYDMICDYIGRLQKVYPKPIPYENNKNIDI